jgi:hypothetical protein
MKIGARGRYEGTAFVVRGKVRLVHSSGSAWEEWHAAFEGGRSGWIACVEERAFITFEDGSWLPAFGDLAEGARGLPAFVVVEKGRARVAGAEGKLPFRPKLGKEYRYADLRGPRGAFATIDYGDDPPTLFAGREVSLAELGLQEGPHAPKRRRPAQGGK